MAVEAVTALRVRQPQPQLVELHLVAPQIQMVQVVVEHSQEVVELVELAVQVQALWVVQAAQPQLTPVTRVLLMVAVAVAVAIAMVAVAHKE